MRLAVLLCLLFGSVLAAEPKPRVAEPSPGMTSDDLIVYTLDATEFGADKTGREDATEAIQAALEASRKVEGGTVFLPAGRYRVNGTLLVPDGTTLRGEWVNPEKGGLGKGTILMAYAGRGIEQPTDHPFLSIKSGSCLRDLSVWYPEQQPGVPVPYPATICGAGHTSVLNVTLYNSWTGFWNNDCSTMMIRRLYGTPLSLGIHGAYAYDIPRIEHVHFGPQFWAASGLPGAPAGKSLTKLKIFLQKHLTCLQGGEQDWGYWWDLDFDTCLKGLFLTAIPDGQNKKVVPGNICAGNVKIRNASVGIYIENAGYPGFMLTYGEITARVCPLYFAPKPDYSAYVNAGMQVSYQSNSSLLVTGVTFHGGKYNVGSMKKGPYGLNFSDCTFTGYSQAAVRSATGSLTFTRCRFEAAKKPSFELAESVDQLVLVGNTFKNAGEVVKGWSAADPRILRDDRDRSVPAQIPFAFNHVTKRKPANHRIWNVLDTGAERGTIDQLPAGDSTAAIQKALDLAGAAKGGTVYVPAGVYRLEGALRVPTGVELRGSFEGPHYGNSTHRGTQLWIYGGKDKPKGAPLVTLAQGSGVKGFSIFYPEQGWVEREDAPAAVRVRKYPPTVRTASDCWVQNLTINCCWTAIDAMTVRSDNLEIADVSGAALHATLEYGHGATGGVVRNLHFNYSSWTHQGRHINRPKDEDTLGRLTDYTSLKVNGLVLGEVSKTLFFSCFNILVADQIVLVKDPYTGGSFKGKMWGVAFDAAHNGVVGKAGCEAQIGLIASMGVFNQQKGGYYAVTEPGFRGRIVFSNADVWSGASRIADLHGGTVTFSQLLSWCCVEAVCHSGATLNMYASTYVADHFGNNDTRDDIRYEVGAIGSAVANTECRKRLTLTVDPAARVTLGVNGLKQ